MTDTIELRIKMLEEKYAVKTLEDIQRVINELNRKVISLKLDESGFRAQAKSLKADIKAINEELKDSSISDKRRSILNYNLEKDQETLKLAQQGIKETNNEIQKQSDLLEAAKVLQKEKSQEAVQQTAEEKQARKDAAEVQRTLDEEEKNRKKQLAEWDREEAEIARQAEEAKQKAIQETIEHYNRLGDAIQNVGALVNVAGDISQWTSDFATGIGNAFSGMSGLFKTDFVDTIGKTLTVLGTKAVTGNIDKIRSRFDIMSTFSDYMELAGVSADDADKALQRVNDSILGLPIGLDEAAQRLRKYQMYMDDLTDATDLTIGVQKAIMAGGANSNMKNYAYTQIDRLLSAGTLTQPRQWYSLMNGLGVSMRFIREAMGVEGMTNAELAAGLASGEISSGAFLRALEDLGRGTSDAARHLDDALGIYKGTLESWLSNIQFAAVRGGENVLKAINNTLIEATNRSITGYLKIVRDTMNDFYKGVASYITERPQYINQIGDAIGGILGPLSDFSLTDFADKVFGRLMQASELFSTILGNIDMDRAEDFAAFATTIAGPLGTMFSAIGNGLPTLIGVFERFEDFDFNDLFEKISDNVEDVADIVSDLLGIFTDSQLSSIIAFGLTKGALVARALHLLGGGLDYIGRTIRGFGDPNQGTLLTWIIAFAQNNPEIAAVAGSVAALYFALKNLQDYDDAQVKQIAEDLGYNEFGKVAEELNNATESLNKAREAAKTSIAEVGDSADKQREMFKKLEELRNELTSPFGPSDRSGIIADMQTVWGEIQNQLGITEGSIDSATGAWDDQLMIIDANKEALIEYKEAQEKIGIINDSMMSLRQEKMNAEIEERIAGSRYTTASNLLDSKNAQLSEWQQFQASHGGALPENVKLSDYVRLEQEIDALEQKVAELGTAWELATDALKATDEELNEYGAELRAASDDVEGMQNKHQWLLDRYMSDDLSTVGEAVRGLTQEYDELREAAYEALSSITSGFEELDEIKPVDLQAIVDNHQTYVDTINQSLHGIYQYVEGLDEAGELTDDIVSLVDKVLTDLQNGNVGSAVGLNDAIINGTVGSIAADSASQDAKTQASANLMGAIEEIMNGAGDALREHQDAFSGLKEAIGDGIFTSDGGLITDDTQKKIEEQMDAVGKSVEGVAQKVSGEDEASLNTAVTTLTTSINTLNEDTMPALNTALDEGGTNIQNFVDNPLTNLEKKLDSGDKSVTTAIKNVITKLNELGSKMVEKANGDFVTFNNGLQSIIDKLAAVESAAHSLAEELTNLGSINTDISVPSTSGGTVYPSTGGLIYLANGGSSGFFKPRGTDTVPAMLTPGEFVVRKKAVDKIGMGVLSMINRMDIPNAIDALMSRVNMPLGHQFVTYDNRKSYDNHATVNQNIYTQNPSFTYRRASRFAHAL